MIELSVGIVTPSFNQGSFLEKTIDSVLSQNYTRLQYVIIDGGSTDGSVEIIRKYEKYLEYWISEADRGQSEAINKGLRRLRTEIWAYLNSDDTYEPGTLHKIVTAFQNSNVRWVTGRGLYVDEKGNPVKEMIPVSDWSLDDVIASLIVDPVMASVQVSTFMRRSVIERFGYFDEDLHYCMDCEYGLRLLLRGIRPYVVDEVLAKATLHSESKTVLQDSAGEFTREKVEILKRLLRSDLNTPLFQTVLNTLRQYQRAQALDSVRSAWLTNGRLAGLNAWVGLAVMDPLLAGRRQALGLLRRILQGSIA